MSTPSPANTDRQAVLVLAIATALALLVANSPLAGAYRTLPYLACGVLLGSALSIALGLAWLLPLPRNTVG